MKKINFFLLRIATIATLLHGGGCLTSVSKTADPPKRSTIQKQSCSQISMDTLSSTEKETFQDLIRDYSQKSSTAYKLCQELASQNAQLELFDAEIDSENMFSAGLSTEDALLLNRKIAENGISLPDTFFHEAEHVVHLKQAHQNGINAASFSSLDDVYTYATLLEALAYRKAALCCREYMHGSNDHQANLKYADTVFQDRLSTLRKPEEERITYETDALKMAIVETNNLPNQVRFPCNPDWNKIVSLMSRGEVTKVTTLPQPTLSFLGQCLAYEIEKHPNVTQLKELDLSCVLAHQSSLRKDTEGIKLMISDLLIEAFDTYQEVNALSDDDARSHFLSVIGWPNANQMNELNGSESFNRIRLQNLKGTTPSKMFQDGISLLQTTPVSETQENKIHLLQRILEFEKQILIPKESFKKHLNKSLNQL